MCQLSISVTKWREKSIYDQQRFVLVHGCRGFGLWMLGPGDTQYIMAELVAEGSSLHSIQEAERVAGASAPNIPFKGMSPVT